ncbi:GNAT family N-acetyltransferase [Nocardia sp. NPDC050793]|uniref:GNAT family N-acetyltransferase n=1 Tax=Nocardia sp. NPDC050793 TaxID=3155159 RepID=UPI0033F0CAF8
MRGRIRLRPATSGDYDAVIAVVDAWWGRPVSASLPRLFFDHFAATSLVAECDGELAGFLAGFFSPDHVDEAYIHFVGVRPGQRGSGLARGLYHRFIDGARLDGRTMIRAITSPGNTNSIAFHEAMGFEVGEPVRDYNGQGRDMVTFVLSVCGDPPPASR